MIEHVLDALARAGVDRPVVVTGHGGDLVEERVASRASTIRQEPQRGTADAVRVGLQCVNADVAQLVVTMGDAPLLTPELFGRLADAQAGGAKIALLTTMLDDATGYGRMVRDAEGRPSRIVEEKELAGTERGLREINVGTYCFDAQWLRDNVGLLQASPSGELYLTDLVAAAVAQQQPVTTVAVDRPELAMGINDRVQLAEAEATLRRRILEEHMRAGVTIVDPASTFIDADVEIGQDARIEPWTVLEGRTVIGQDAVIGPASHLSDSQIGPRTQVLRSVVEESSVAEDCQIGPFAHLRPGSEIGARCRIGNYAEVKKSRIGADTQQHHFSYLGDADVGEGVNIGAGTVTANYDGVHKNRTIIGDGAFLGVDTMLRAPVTIGRGAKTGAGSVVTKDVPDGKTVVGIPARPIEIRRRSAQLDPESRPEAERAAEPVADQ